MERHFTLPLAFSAAIHGALFLDFQEPSRVATPESATKREATFLIPFTIPEPPDPVEDTADATPADEPKAAVVTSPEPPSVELPSRPTMTLPPPQRIGPVIDTSIIPTNWNRPGGFGSGEFTQNIVTAGLLDQPPRTRVQASPVYPFEGRASGLNGEVVVDFLVDEQGQVRDPKVVRSSHRMFEEPSLRAISKWRFEPGRRDGQIVRFRMSVPVQFSLH